MIEPMLATLAREPFDSADHIFEWKWDGVRALARVSGGSVSLTGRSGTDLTPLFPEIRLRTEYDLLLDGELVCLGPNGLPDFQRIQHRINRLSPRGVAQQYPAVLMVFDILEVGGKSLIVGAKQPWPLMDRKLLLETKRILSDAEHVKVTRYVEQGTALFREVMRLGGEGIMAKTRDGLYYPGRRHSAWQKVKVSHVDTFVIGGYTLGTGWREDMMGGVILGTPENGKLRWVATAGSGFTEAALGSLLARLRTLETAECPFLPGTKVAKQVAWVKPVLKARVKYAEKTNDGHLRWPIFLGVVN